MKIAFCTALLVFSFAAFANANEDNDNWPCYMRKCNMNDPNIKECLLRHSNYALLTLIKGDPKLGIPNYETYTFKNLTLGKNRDFKIHFDEAQLAGCNHLNIVDMNWDFKTKTICIKLGYHNSIVLSGNYVSSGKFQGRPIKGDGHADLIFVGGNKGATLTYTGHYDLMKVDGNDYVQMKDRVCTREESFRVNFNNYLLTDPQAKADLQYLNKHSDAANAALSDDIKELICKLVEHALNPVFYNFPLNVMFDKN